MALQDELLLQAPCSPGVGVLKEAYHATRYRVFGPAGAFDMRISALSADLDRCLQYAGQTEAVFFSGVNPGSLLLPAVANAARDETLRRALAVAGALWYPAAGIPLAGDWPVEDSVLVVGWARAQGVRWARAFGQKAMLYGRIGQPVSLLWC